MLQEYQMNNLINQKKVSIEIIKNKKLLQIKKKIKKFILKQNKIIHLEAKILINNKKDHILKTSIIRLQQTKILIQT